MSARKLVFAAVLLGAPAWLAPLLPVAAAQDAGMLVQVDAVKREPLSQKFTVIGRLVSRQRGVVAARVEGPVAALRVQIGDRVRAGEVLAVIDRGRFKWQRVAAAADVAESKASVVNAEARVAMSEAGVAAAEARLALARQELGRLAGLRDSVAFSQARYDDKRQEAAAAQGDLDLARAEVQEALSLIDQGRAGLQRARAILALADGALAHTEIRAPYDGVVTLRHTEVGAYLEVGDAVVTLVNDRDIEVEADVPFNRLAGLAPGVEVPFWLDDGGPYRAAVRAIGVEENPRTRTRSVRFTPLFEATPDNLADGQSAVLELPIGRPREVVSVHKDAVIRALEGAVVFVIVDGAVERRLVVLGEATGGRFEVLDGLVPGDLVVVRGNERLKSGQAVRFEESS